MFWALVLVCWTRLGQIGIGRVQEPSLFRISYWSSRGWWNLFSEAIERFYSCCGLSSVLGAEDQLKWVVVGCGQCKPMIMEWIFML